MSGSLFIKNRQRTIPINVRHLRRLTRALLQDLLGIDDFDLAIYLVRAPEMARINQAYLQHAGSTDVITFDYQDKTPARVSASPPPAAPLHGELFICVDEAIAQARRFRTTWQSEVARYTIHGILHLQGHDDVKPGDRRKMKRVEDRLLKQIARLFPLSKIARNPRVAP